MSRALRDACRPVVIAAALVALAAPSAVVAGEASPPAALQVGRWRLQSNPWVNLHQRLVHEARFASLPPPLAGEELLRWQGAVTAYREWLGKRNPVFDGELIRMNAKLSTAAAASPPSGLPAPAARALAAAMPLYRAQWEQDDRVNRFWIAVAEPLLRDAGEELAAAHARVYGVPFPERIRVDVAAHGWQFGAYTVTVDGDAHVVIASTDPGMQGFAALEMLLHEPSHAIVGVRNAAIGDDLVRLGGTLGIEPPQNLWHAILFYTSSELTRGALAARGVTEYRPVTLGMYERGYAPFRSALETHWQAVLEGRLGREEALRSMLLAMASPPRS